jgi:hypothetical protein
MTEIAVRNEQNAVVSYGTDSMDRLSRWVEQARAVSEIAADICATSFAPAAYRGKPAEATAAILAGAELGFDPMASLRAFDSIQGVPAPKAITLRAVVQGAGHKLVIDESTPERAVVRGLRKGETEWQTSTWDIDRARRLDLLKKDQWQKQPQAMLVARATAEVCRWIASDAVMGMPYAAEEIADETPVVAPAVRRLTAAELDDGLPPGPDAGLATEMLGDDQRKRMFVLWRDLGYDGDENRKTRLQLTAKFIGADQIESSNDLTRAEAETVIAKLLERKAATAPVPDGAEK